MPRASFSHAVEVAAAAETIWAALQEAATWSGIGPVDEVWEAAHADDGSLQSFRWSAHVGPSRYKGSAEVAIAEPPHHIKLKLDSSELVGSLIADLDSDGTPTRLVVTLEVASKSAIAAMFFPVIAEAIGRGLPRQVEEFAGGVG